MKRRGFLGALAGLLASPVLAKLPVPIPKHPNGILYTLPDAIPQVSKFVPEIWSYNIMKIYMDDAAKRLAEDIDRDMMQYLIEDELAEP